jgi:lycopene cyclase domain-containing protein
MNGFHNGGAVWIGITIHILFAVVYTTPWDNYLIATNVWYYNPELVTGWVISYVPIEEYTFFVLETILAGLWWWFLARRISPPQPEFTLNKFPIYVSTCLFISLWLLFTYLFFFGPVKWTYLSITLFWALPPIIIQLLFGADILWHYRKLVFWAILIPGTYLSLIDIVALKPDYWNFILWASPPRRNCLLLRYKHSNHIWHDAPTGKRQPGEVCRNKEFNTSVEGEAER